MLSRYCNMIIIRANVRWEKEYSNNWDVIVKSFLSSHVNAIRQWYMTEIFIHFYTLDARISIKSVWWSKGADTPILLKITSFNLNCKEPKHSHDVTLRNCQNKTNKTIHGLCDATMSWLICCAKVCIHVGIRIDEKLKKGMYMCKITIFTDKKIKYL